MKRVESRCLGMDRLRNLVDDFTWGNTLVFQRYLTAFDSLTEVEVVPERYSYSTEIEAENFQTRLAKLFEIFHSTDQIYKIPTITFE